MQDFHQLYDVTMVQKIVLSLTSSLFYVDMAQMNSVIRASDMDGLSRIRYVYSYFHIGLEWTLRYNNFLSRELKHGGVYCGNGTQIGGWNFLRYFYPIIWHLALAIMSFWHPRTSKLLVHLMKLTLCVCKLILPHIATGESETLSYNSDCLRFSFLHILQKELQQVATEWNHHIIRPTSSSFVPSGCPEVLFFMPESLGVVI